MTRTVGLLSFSLIVASPLLAGALFELEITDHGESPPRVQTAEIMVQGRDLRMQVPSGDQEPGHEIIFHGETRELVMIDHTAKRYFTIDQASLERMAAQLDSAVNQMEQALENVPSEQRAMMEKMMKSRMPAAVADASMPTELKQTAEEQTTNGYPCVKYEVLRDGEKIKELWVTNFSNIDGGDELATTFEELSDLFRTFTETASRAAGKLGGFGAQIDDSPFEHMKAMKGFPVLSRQFRGGVLERESALRSARQRVFDPDAFDPPAGYKPGKMFEGRRP